MGLSICLRKPKLIGSRIPEKIERFLILSENTELSVFEHLCFNRKNGYYDLAKAIKDKGYDADNLEHVSIEYGHSVYYKYFDIKHPLYAAHLYLDSIWSKTYFLTKKELKESEYYKHFVDEFLTVCVEHGWKKSYKFYAKGNKITYWNLVNVHNFCHRKIKVSIKNPPVFHKIEKCLAYDEVGYASGGANKDFYDYDSEVGFNCVLTKNELIEHWEKYFSDNEVGKDNFKNWIIDKFVEGETFVTYC